MRVYSLTKVSSFRWIVLPVVALTLLLGVSASAAILSFEANLDGLQEVPPNASPAFGLADFTLGTVSGFATITSASYQDLLGNSTAVTLNAAAPRVNGPVILVLTLDAPSATTGTFSGGGTLTAGNVLDMIATSTYINLRNNVFPSGEIRGQLFQVPEPSSVMLACSGLLGLWFVGRRKK